MTHVEDRWRDGNPRNGTGLRYRVRYIDPSNRERSQSFKLKRDADNFAKTIGADLLRGSYVDPAAGRITLKAFAEDWMAGRVDLRPSTRELYQQHLDLRIVPALGSHQLAAIRATHVRAAVRLWSATLAPTTVRVTFAVLSGVLSSAVSDGRILKSPATGTPLPQTSPRVVEPLPPKKVTDLIEAISQRYRVAVVLGAGAGLRLGEVLGLTRPRVDFLRRRVAVEQQLQLVPGDEILAPLKTPASRRVVPVDDVVLETVARHIETYDAHPSGVLVTSAAGNLVSRDLFGHRWTDAVTAAGLPRGTRFHDLRHFYASTLIASGLHPKAIQTRLGHASITETMDTYGHLFPEHEEAGRGALDAVLRSSSDGPATAQGGDASI